MNSKLLLGLKKRHRTQPSLYGGPNAHQETKSGRGSAVDHFKPGILALMLGKRDAQTFQPLWQQVEVWQCYFSLTDGWTVYPCFLDRSDHEC